MFAPLGEIACDGIGHPAFDDSHRKCLHYSVSWRWTIRNLLRERSVRYIRQTIAGLAASGQVAGKTAIWRSPDKGWVARICGWKTCGGVSG